MLQGNKDGSGAHLAVKREQDDKIQDAEKNE